MVNGDVAHNREVIYLKDFDLWIVSDKMVNASGGAHSYTQTWNFPGYSEVDQIYGYLEGEVNTDEANKKDTHLRHQ